MEAAAAGQSVQSVVCCGHSPKSQIRHMAFQPGGAFLVRGRGSALNPEAYTLQPASVCLLLANACMPWVSIASQCEYKPNMHEL